MFYRLLILVFFYSFVCTPADSRVIQKRAAFYIANETMCIVDGAVYRNGDPVPTDDECERCTCRPPGFSCVLRDCDSKPGCKAVRKVGECCPEYVCGCVHNNRLYEDGELIKDLQNNCYTCRCHGSSISCIFADCHFRSDCQPVYVQGECCPRYDHCPPISTTTTTTKATTPSSYQVQEEIDFVNFTTQHLQKFTDEGTTVIFQDVSPSDSGFTTPAYEISKETLLSVKFTLSNEKFSSIHDFDITELTTLLPLQSVTYKEVTRHVIPPLHTELTTLKDGLTVEESVKESDKTTMKQLGQTEIPDTSSITLLDHSKEGVSDTYFANVDDGETTKYEPDEIKLSVTKDEIFVPVGFEKSTETTTDSQLKTTEVTEKEISTFQEKEVSSFASGSKMSTSKQEDQTESLQPVFVTTVTSERQDTTTQQLEADHFPHLNISYSTVAELHTDSDESSAEDTQATSTEYSLSSTSDVSSSGTTLDTGEKVSEDFTFSTVDDLDSQSTNLQTSDSIHGDLQTSDSIHGDLQSSDSIHGDLQTSDSIHGDLQTSDSIHGDLQTSDSTHGDLQTSDSIHGDLQTSDSIHGDLQTSDSTYGDLQTSDSIHGDLQTSDSIHGDLQTSDSIHGDLKTSDSIHGDLQTPDSKYEDLSTFDSEHIDSQSSESEKDDLHSSTQEHIELSTTMSGSTELHSVDLHTDDEEEFSFTNISSPAELTTDGKIYILHSTSGDSQEFDTEHEAEISTTGEETDITTNENSSSIFESSDDKIETSTSIEATELQTTDDNTVTSGLTGQHTDSSVHHEYTDSVISKSTDEDIRISTEVNGSTQVSNEFTDINSFTITLPDKDLTSANTTDDTHYSTETTTDHDSSVTAITPEDEIEELDSMEHHLSTVLHGNELLTETSALETDGNVDENYSTHSVSVITSEQQGKVNETDSQEITSESLPVTISTLEDVKSSFHHTSSSFLTKLPSNDNMDISELTHISPSTIYTELDLTKDETFSTSFKHEMTDFELESETTDRVSTSGPASTTVEDLSSPSIYTEDKSKNENDKDSSIAFVENTESDDNLLPFEKEKTAEPASTTVEDLSFPSIYTEDISKNENDKNSSITFVENTESDDNLLPFEKEKTTEFVPYLSTETDVSKSYQTNYSITVIKNDNIAMEENNNDNDTSEVIPSETDREESVQTTEDYSTTYSNISTDLIEATHTHEFLETEVSMNENANTFSSRSSEEFQASKTSPSVVETAEDELVSKQDETTITQDDIHSSKQPYTITDHTTSPFEDDSDNKLTVHTISDKSDKGTTETNLEITLGASMSTLTVAPSTTDESKIEDFNESDQLQVKHDTKHLSTHEEVSTQSSESIQTTTLKPTAEKASSTPENGIPSEIPGFEPPLANILKQQMLFNRQTTNEENGPNLIPVESSQNNSSSHSDDNEVSRLSLTLAEEESEKNESQHIYLTDSIPESDENTVFVLNHEYTISDTEINDIDFFDAEEIDLTSEETEDHVQTVGNEEPSLISTLHSSSTMNEPHLETSKVEDSTKIDVENPVHSYNDNDIKIIHTSAEQTDSKETKIDTENNTNTLQLNSLPEVSKGLDKTDSSFSNIHKIDNNLIHNVEGKASESVNNNEVLSTVSVGYFSTKSESLSSEENTKTTSTHLNTDELVSDENSDLIIYTTMESDIHNIQETPENYNTGNEDDTGKHDDASAEPTDEEFNSEFEDVSTGKSESDNSQDIQEQTGVPSSHQDVEDFNSTEQESEIHSSIPDYKSGLHPDLLTALQDISSTLQTNFQSSSSENFNGTVNLHEENYSESFVTENGDLENASTIKVNILFGQNFFDSSKVHDTSTTAVTNENELITKTPVYFHIDNEDSLTNSDSKLENESSISYDPSEYDKNNDLKESIDEKTAPDSLVSDAKIVEYQDAEIHDDSVTDVDSDLNSQRNLFTMASESANKITDSEFSEKDLTTGNDFVTSENKAYFENTSSIDLINSTVESSSPFTILEYIGDLFSKFTTLSSDKSESTLNEDITPTKEDDLTATEDDSETSDLTINNSSGTNEYSSLLKDQFSQYGYLGGVYITAQSKYNGSSKEHVQPQNNDRLSENHTTDNELSPQTAEPVLATSLKSAAEISSSSSSENDFPTDTPNFEHPLAHIFKHPMFANQNTPNKEANLNLHQVDTLSSINKDDFLGSITAVVSSFENLDANHHNSNSEVKVFSEEHHSETEAEIAERTSSKYTTFSTTTNEELKSEGSENIEIFDSEALLNTEYLDEHSTNNINSFPSTISFESPSTETDAYVTTINSDANKDILENHTILLTSTLSTLEETSEKEFFQLSSNNDDNSNSVSTEIEVNKEEGSEKETEYFEPTEPHFPLANSVRDEETFDTLNTNAEAQATINTEQYHKSGDTGEELETFTELFHIHNGNAEIKSTTSDYVDPSATVEISDKSSTLIINKDQSLSTSVLPTTKSSILDVTEINYDSTLISKHVPPLPILLKHMNDDNVKVHIPESLPIEIDETNLNDSENANISLTETDQNEGDDTTPRFGYGRSHVHPLHLTDVVSQVFKAPGYDSEFRSSLYNEFAPLRKTRELRLKREEKNSTEKIQQFESDIDSEESALNNDSTSVTAEENYSIKNKNVLLVEGFGQKPSGFFPVTSSLIIVQSDEETEENEYKKNAKRKEAVVQPEASVAEVKFHNDVPFGSPSDIEKPSDLKKTYSVK